MAEQLTSQEDAILLKGAINHLSNHLEGIGFDRGQIGAAMAGIGIGMVQVHVSHDDALRLVDTVRDCLLSDASIKS